MEILNIKAIRWTGAKYSHSGYRTTLPNVSSLALSFAIDPRILRRVNTPLPPESFGNLVDGLTEINPL